MAITPNTNLKLLKCPLSLDNKNQLTFANETAQFNYFNSLPSIEKENFKYIRLNSVIRFPAHIDTLLEYNYCMYQNDNYSNKWFYAYIIDMKYINDNMTEISIISDVWQTWQFELSFKDSFIEREMINVADDVPGSNLMPENVELGELKINRSENISDLEPMTIIAFTGDTFSEESVNQNGFEYNGIFSAITFIVTNSLNVALQIINLEGNGDKIFTVFTVPKLAIKDFLPVDPPRTNNLLCFTY